MSFTTWNNDEKGFMKPVDYPKTTRDVIQRRPSKAHTPSFAILECMKKMYEFKSNNIKEILNNLGNVLYIYPDYRKQIEYVEEWALFAIIKEEKGVYKKVQITTFMSSQIFKITDVYSKFIEEYTSNYLKDFILLNGNATILNPAHFKGFNYYQLNIYALFNDGVATRIDHYEEDMKPYLTKESNFIDNYEIIENHCYGIMERCVIPKLKEKEETKTKKLAK